MSKVQQYINRIRNVAKRDYARKYALHVLHNAPKPEPGGLSYMAAQAVRMRVDSLACEVFQARIDGRAF